MADSKQFPPLKPLHHESLLNPGKLSKYEQVSTEILVESLLPGKEGCLKTRPDGTILDGHHRVHVLRGRGVPVDDLPRDLVVKDEE